MATFENTTRIHRTRSLPWQVGRFFLHLLEMLLAMFAGMGLFHLVFGLIPESSNYAEALKRGTTLHTIVMNAFMVVPMIAWMILRGHGWRHSMEMVVAMLAPIAMVSLLCGLGVDEYLPWLAEASAPAMFLGMIAAMLYRRNHYMAKGGHSVHVNPAAVEKPCH